MNIELIKLISEKMRNSICKLPEVQTLKRPEKGKFPYGWCHDASLLLGAYLVDNGFNSFQYVHGEDYRTGNTHAWLVWDKLIVDITADQFSKITPPVIVSESTHWHDRFTVIGNGKCDFRQYESQPDYIRGLKEFYENMESDLFPINRAA